MQSRAGYFRKVINNTNLHIATSCRMASETPEFKHYYSDEVPLANQLVRPSCLLILELLVLLRV